MKFFRPLPFPQLILGAIVLALAGTVTHLAGQTGNTLTLLTREGRRTIPLATANGQEMIALDELASLFQFTVREDAGAITVSTSGRTIVLTPEQTMASVAGRVISLPVPPARIGGRWFVPIDFISRAVAPISDTRVELRRPSRLLLVGDVRVPRVAIRHEALGNAARITIEISPRANATVAQDAAQHLTVRVDADAVDPSFPPGTVPGFIQGYRQLEFTSIGIELAGRFATFRSAVQVQDTSTRLVIDLLPGANDTPAPPAPSPTTTQAEPAPPELPVLTGTGGWLRSVAIDAGHGGDDAGAKGTGGTAEKNVTLAVARRLKAAIEARLGLRVVMTREDDRRLVVTERTAIANNNKADLFLSLHANASFRPAVSGAVIYVASFDEQAERAASTPERLPAYGGGFRDLELVPWNLAQLRYRDQSEALAGLVAEQFKDRVPLAARNVDHAPLRVLESANMPAVLIEIGYLTNKAQEAQLANAEFQGAVAQGLVDAIVRFRDVASQSEGAGR